MKDFRQNRHWVECDVCEDVESSEKGEFWQEFWNRLKALGWKTQTVGRDWVHACPKCKL